MSPQVVSGSVITGASSGFGRSMTELALRQDDTVVAALRKPEALSEPAKQYLERLFLQSLNVTNKEQVAAAFAAAKDTFGRIDVLFKNAGIITVGEVEGTPDDVVRDLFGVNYWGNLNVTLKALEYFRMNGNSVVDFFKCRLPVVYRGPQEPDITLRPLEGISTALANELDPAWNIKITLLEPDFFRTEGAENAPSTLLPQHPAYANFDIPVTLFRKAVETGLWVADGNVTKAVEAFYRLTLLENPPLRLPLHRKAIEIARRKAKELERIADEYESWSDGVYLEA